MIGRIWRRVLETLRRDFVAGLLVFVPVGFTILGVLWSVDQLDKLVLPAIFDALGLQASQPPLIGALTTLLVILLAGSLARSFIGRTAIRFWERSIDRVPVARSLYTVLKQFMEAIFETSAGGGANQNFSRVVLIEYPRRGIYSYAFVTGPFKGEVDGLQQGLLQIFIPSTPNPTTGYFLLVPESDVLDTGLSVEDAFKTIISAGIATTPTTP